MSRPRSAEPVKLVASFLSTRDERIAEAIRGLAKVCGDPDFVGPCHPFSFTEYYEGELGSPLRRRFVSFERLAAPDSLPAVKLQSNSLEERLAEGGKRTVNIDPGYISLAHMILATCKGYTHRPYLRDGVYADLTLLYQDRRFRTLPWTYPDYAAEETREMFRTLRERYVLQLKQMGASS
ncbi:MAG: DUF4416 domain-containing protein [Deltaproteobacteria bacterium HGW-Deltaproteobacteria-19]|jgi:hypothetical protein|nr:MAG: DUF4416 domain-containing protein [Deltaproteobacteria bacterium HGW-Deltaproteobacteria-19]